jgi:hypothetical protein
MNYFLNSNHVTYIEKFKPEHVHIFSGKCIITKRRLL